MQFTLEESVEAVAEVEVEGQREQEAVVLEAAALEREVPEEEGELVEVAVEALVEVEVEAREAEAVPVEAAVREVEEAPVEGAILEVVEALEVEEAQRAAISSG